MRHLLSVVDLDAAAATALLDTADRLRQALLGREVRKLPTLRGTTDYTFEAFWIQNPRVKTWYRRNEHALQSAETLATLASMTTPFEYPVQELYESWIQMLLNMDRNTLWGAAGGMVFESDTSWDVRDRMENVEATTQAIHAAALGAIIREGDGAAIFNSGGIFPDRSP